MNVNTSGEKTFLNRLTEITEANLTNSQFGVSELASEFGKSRSYIHRRLKHFTNESVSQFIRKIRLEKALELLKQDKLTVAEIAYEVGFGSPSYFIKCFHNEFGYAPREYKKYAIEKDVDKSNNDPEQKESTPKSLNRKRMPGKLLILVLGIAIIVVSLFVYKTFIEYEPEKSIAVLSLKNLSDDTEIQHLADGIMEDIRTRLSHIKDLEVKSQISSEKYCDTQLSAREIAKELGVSYILEGSIIPDKEKIRINIQLISAKKDDHKWAEFFDKDLTGIHEFITDVSKQVTEKLKVVLSTEEINPIGKTHTDNTEAYNYYLEGRFYHRLRTKESFKKSMEYHNKALELDSNYCLAYAGLADVYLTSTWFGNFTKEEGTNISRAYALKALSIDKNLAEAHATLGTIATHFDYDWDTAEKEFKLAVQTDSRNPRIYDLYAQYFDVVGKKEEAREYINKALQLTPNDVSILWFSYYLYRKEGNYIKALELSDKISYIDGNERRHLRQNFEIYLMQNNISKAIEEYKNMLTLISPEIDTEIVDSIYATDGKDGFVHYVIEFELKQNAWSNTIATYYAMINEKDSALTFLERSYESGIGGIERVVGEKEFDNLRSEPRFKELLRKINLADEQVSSFQNN